MFMICGAWGCSERWKARMLGRKNARTLGRKDAWMLGCWDARTQNNTALLFCLLAF